MKAFIAQTNEELIEAVKKIDEQIQMLGKGREALITLWALKNDADYYSFPTYKNIKQS